MKIVTVCLGGQIRSVAMANFLNRTIPDVIAVPQGAANPHPINYNWYMEWADKIICMQTKFLETIPEQYRNKVLICDVGEDTYHRSDHPLLLQLISDWYSTEHDRLNGQIF